LNSYKDNVFTWFFRSLPTVTLTFKLLIPKANQHIYEPKYICDQNLAKFPLSKFFRYGVHKVFGSLPAVTSTSWPQNLISTYMNPSTSATKIGWNSLC